MTTFVADRRQSEPGPLRSAADPGALLAPLPLTSLVGRDQDAAVVLDLLGQPDVRLVTLTGPGGVGKTRLSLRLAEVARPLFPDGVWFIPLAPVSEPGVVASTIALVVGVRESAQRTPLEDLMVFLRDRRALLVLDNFEHLLEAAVLVTDLLVHCRRLTCLVTSRALLEVSGEHVFPVPPLDTDAARLFVERAQAVRPGLVLTSTSSAAVAAICRALDGLPLAIELAAARVRHLSPGGILARLQPAAGSPDLGLLSGGPRDAPERHRTLRDTIAWSYNLLSPHEQSGFRRLAVFRGGFSLEGAEAVGRGSRGTDPRTQHSEAGTRRSHDARPSTFDLLASLVDNSLVQQHAGPNGEGRYQILETVREFAREALTASDEDAAVRHAHAIYYLTLIERAEPEFNRGNQRVWLDRIEAEHANVREALAWLEHTGSTAELLRLVTALLQFWWFQGQFAEAGRWFERAINCQGDAPPSLRLKALLGAARLAVTVGDADRAEALVQEAEALHVATDQTGSGWPPIALVASAVAMIRGDATRAASLAEDALARFRMAGDEFWLSIALGYGLYIARSGEVERGTALIEEALALDLARGDHYYAGVRLSDLGFLAHDGGDEARATAYYDESIRVLFDVGGVWYLASPIAGLAAIAAPGDPARAARLLGAVETLRERSGTHGWPTEQARDEQAAAIARSALGEAAFAREWATGRTMPIAEVVREAGAVAVGPSPLVPQSPGTVGDLSPREVEVLRLLVAGHSDREIGEILFISPRTASKHVGSILAKLDVGSRAAAVAHAVRAGIA